MKKKLSGTVRENRVSKGSKSERNAFVLETAEGTFVLRKAGEHPFGDYFAPYRDKQLTVTGDLEGLTLFVDNIHE